MIFAKFKIILLPIFLISCARTPQVSNFASNEDISHREQYESYGKKYAIATQGIAASSAAKAILNQGGNLIDAAAAVSFVIAVERPQSTGIGGGGFLIYREAKTGKVYAVDFRERAPAAATEKMFLDKNENPIQDLSTDGALAVGVPGLVAGVLEIQERFGMLSREQILAPAIKLAAEGFPVYPHLENALLNRKTVLAKYPSSAKIFLKPNKDPYKSGELLVQKDLAQSLLAIVQEGANAFYKGTIGRAIAKESAKQKGLLSLADLRAYKVKWRIPIEGKYKGYTLISMPPPSSGGTHVLEILNILSQDSLPSYGSAKTVHLEAAAMQQAFADRASYMGDPDFIKIPLHGLLSKGYAQEIRSQIPEHRARASNTISAGNPEAYESTETTNFSLMDAEGNMVVSTQTLNGWMGSGLVVPGTGILLNNEMDDFSAKAGSSNAYGAIGGVPNSIAPHKTPLSSMAPTLVLRDNKPILALGAPGGTRIISCVAQTLLNYLELRLPLYESIANIRIHHQWKPDQIDIEYPGLSQETQQELRNMGYTLNLGSIPCRVNAVALEENMLHGVADPRDLGSSISE